MDLLRFAAAGSVDDGKSTLVGRLLHDSKQLFDDQLDALEAQRLRHGRATMDLATITDGLRAEREQGITIDVAYRYAATPRRKFVIADCPGHLQYTRNMATGASTADLLLLVVDASSGLKPQTRRHLCIAALLGVRQVVACVNKMDLTGWSPAAFAAARDEIATLCDLLGIETLTVIPVSALGGDNVVDRTSAAPFYDGPSVLEALEAAPASTGHGGGTGATRLPVQWVVNHPGGTKSFAGMVSGAPLHTGDAVVVLPAGSPPASEASLHGPSPAGASVVTSIETSAGRAAAASPGISVRVELAGNPRVVRGDIIAAQVVPPEVTRRFDAAVCWFSGEPLAAGGRYIVKHTTRRTEATALAVAGVVDVNHLALAPGERLVTNDIGIVRWETAEPLAVDDYATNRTTGSFVVIDTTTNATVGAGMVGVPDLPTA